jgi:electron transfer flavoprotein alpha subunit
MTRRFWVFLEQEACCIHPVSWELLGAARQLAAEVHTESDPAVVEGILIGQGVEGLAAEAFRYGAERVYLLEDAMYSRYLNRAYSDGFISLIRKYAPEVVLVGATTLGRDLAGSVATALRTGLTADCTQLQMGDVKDVFRKLLLATRPAFGGNVIATIVCKNSLPQMATVRPRVFCVPIPKAANGAGEIIRETVSDSTSLAAAQIVEIIENDRAGVKLEYADIIISGGRGLGKPAGFALLHELATELGGVVGSSRACVDAGWIPYEHQVGQTGKTVRPKLYIAAGISGAIQHKVGMQHSDFVLAINSDPHAPIFDVATYGIVGDLYKVIPALIENIRSRKESQHA